MEPIKIKKKYRRRGSRKKKPPRPKLLLHKIREAPGPKKRKKACTQCKEVKWLGEFYTSHKPGRGHSYKSECKHCSNRRARAVINRVRKKKNQGGDPIYQAYQREYYKKNREKFLEYRRQFLIRNPNYFYLKNKQRADRLKREKIEARHALNDKDCT